jgi:hypothetical protein
MRRELAPSAPVDPNDEFHLTGVARLSRDLVMAAITMGDRAGRNCFTYLEFCRPEPQCGMGKGRAAAVERQPEDLVLPSLDDGND